jgi:hypothetical protein
MSSMSHWRFGCSIFPRLTCYLCTYPITKAVLLPVEIYYYFMVLVPARPLRGATGDFLLPVELIVDHLSAVFCLFVRWEDFFPLTSALSFLPLVCVFLCERTKFNCFKLHLAKMSTDETALTEQQKYAKYVFWS